MKILYIITGLGQGGAERVTCDLADKMNNLGHDVGIIYFYGEAITKPKSPDISITKISLESYSDLMLFFFSLIKYIRKFNPDIIHSHMFHANIVTRIIRPFIRVPRLINTAHSSNEGDNIRMALYRITDRLTDLTTNVSEYATQTFINLGAVPRNRIRTVYNGIDFSKFNFRPDAHNIIRSELNIPSNKKIILAVRRFHSAKNYFNLINAISLLKNRNNNFVLLIAGEGELRNEIEKLIVDKELENHVNLLGSRNDIPLLMSACDVFVLSSDYEGLPTVLIEALGCEAHIVSTDVSGAQEIIQDNGLIVPTKDPLALSNVLYQVLESENRGRNVKGSLLIKEQFNLGNIAATWMKIYNDE